MNFKNIDVSKIKFGDLVESKKQKGYKSGNITYEGQPLLIQFPLVMFPFGVSPPNAEHGITKYSLQISRDENGATKPIIGELFQKFEEIEKHLLNHAFENAAAYFGGKKSLETCKDFMNKVLKYDKNEEKAAKYGPRLSPVVPYDFENHKFIEVECFDIDGSPISPDLVGKKSKGFVTVHVATNYSVGAKAYGITMTVKSIKVKKHASNAAPPIQEDMYGVDPELEAAMLEAPMPESMYAEDHEELKRDRAEEPPAAAEEPAKKKGKNSKK